jgi:hypothetical protein
MENKHCSILKSEFTDRTTFIAGAGRCGTTWLGKLLDSSSRVFYKHEPDNPSLPWFRGIPSRLEPIDENDSHRDHFASAIEQAFWSHGLQFIQEPYFPKVFLRHRALALFNYSLRGFRKFGITEVSAVTLPRCMFRDDTRNIHLVIKSVRSNLRLAWIHRHFPHFRIVLLIRHPGGYLGSWLRARNEQGWTGFGERQRLDSTVLPFSRPEHQTYLEAYEQGSPFERELIYWIVANEIPLLELRRSPVFKVVVYEELCAEPERVLREVYEHSGIPFGEQTLRFVKASTSKQKEGFHDVFKDPKFVANRWHDELTTEQIETVERYLAATSLAGMWS